MILDSLKFYNLQQQVDESHTEPPKEEEKESALHGPLTSFQIQENVSLESKPAETGVSSTTPTPPNDKYGNKHQNVLLI